MIYVGADVHVRNTMYNVADEEGQRLQRGRCANILGELAAWFAPIERRARQNGEAVRVVMESTTNSRAMQRLLAQYGKAAGIDLTAEVLHARKLRVIADSVSKSDKIDGDMLTELARSNLKLPVCYMPDDEEFALREHLRARSDLVRMRTMLKNRIHAVFHRRGILTPEGDLFGKAGRTFLEQAPLEEAGRTIVERYLAAMDQLEEIIGQSTGSLRELTHRQRWAKPVALLQTMPGVGMMTALTILAELGDIRRFRSRAAVSNYAGMVPRSKRSNERCWYGGISHAGPSHLRAMLVEAAWIGCPKVPFYQALFDRVSRVSDRRRAITAVARRMLEDGWMMLVKNEAFRYIAPRSTNASGVAG